MPKHLAVMFVGRNEACHCCRCCGSVRTCETKSTCTVATGGVPRLNRMQWNPRNLPLPTLRLVTAGTSITDRAKDTAATKLKENPTRVRTEKNNCHANRRRKSRKRIWIPASVITCVRRRVCKWFKDATACRMFNYLSLYPQHLRWWNCLFSPIPLCWLLPWPGQISRNSSICLINGGKAFANSKTKNNRSIKDINCNLPQWWAPSCRPFC